MRRGTLLPTLELIIALPDDTAVFVIGIPHFSSKVLPAVAADDAAGKDALAAVFPAYGLAPEDLFLHPFKKLRSDNGLMAVLYIILGDFALIDLHLFVNEIYREFLLRYDPITDTIQFFLRDRVQGGSNFLGRVQRTKIR